MRERKAEPGKIYSRPLRKVNTRASRNITGFVCSRKMADETIDHESRNELAFVKRAEIDPRVSEIYAQPILVRYRNASAEWADAFPDFAIVIDGIMEIHEVKPDAQYARPDIRDSLSRIAGAVERYGYRYSVALASVVHRRRDASAIEDAWRRLKTDVHPMTLRAVDDLLVHGPLTIGDLLSATTRHNTTIAQFHAMLARGYVRADMNIPADADMVVHGRSSDVWFERLVPFNDPRDGSL